MSVALVTYAFQQEKFRSAEEIGAGVTQYVSAIIDGLRKYSKIGRLTRYQIC